MKSNCLIIIALLLASQAATAQFTARGNFVMGASVGLSNANSKVKEDTGTGTVSGQGPSSRQFSITPKVGYLLVDNFALGLGLDFTNSQIKQPNEDVIKDSDLLFGPFTRYYLMAGDDKAFFFELNFGFGNSSDNKTIGGVQNNIQTNIFAVGAGPGFTIFSSDAIGIEALVKYNFARSKFNTDIGGTQTTTITLTNQVDLSLGILFYFEGISRAKSGGGGSNQRLY